MLDVLRKSAAGWIAKLFIGLLVISFAIWGIADIFTGFGTSSIAKVGETEIPAGTFRNAYNRELQLIGRQLNRGLTPEEGVAAGIPGQVLGRLVSEATLDEEARNRGLGISDETLARQIQNDPALQNGSGRFDRNMFRQLLANNDMNEDFYVRQRRGAEMRQQLSDAVTGGLEIPTAYLEAMNRYMDEERVASYIVLGPEQLGDIADPSDDELKAYFEKNTVRFRAPEYRKLMLMSVVPATVARPEDVGEDDIRAAYDAAGDRFKTPEKRRIRQIVFADKQQAEEAAAKIAGGTSFADIMAERKLTDTDVDLGLVTKSDLIDPAVADAGFALADGAVSGVVDGRFGSVLVTASDVTPGTVTPFEEVRDTLARELAEKNATREVLELSDTIEDARAGGSTLEEIAKRFDLKTRIVEAVDESGNDPDKKSVDLPKKAEFLKLVFESDVGLENDPLQLPKGFLWYEVMDVSPARDRALDEIRNEVVAAWKKEQYQTQANKKVADLVTRLNGGETLEQVATDVGVAVQESGRLKRQSQDPIFTPQALNALFSGPEGHAASGAGVGDQQIIVVVKDIFAPAFFAEAAGVPELKNQLTAQLRNSMMTQYIAEVQRSVGVSVNQATLQRSIGLLTQ
ncbi:MAG: peptidylprolyl isomerase [Hyphomicrobiales bacterium]|nr:MAG: peptidylprolyl isomerase [Hyphomicrobiales bacterium]